MQRLVRGLNYSFSQFVKLTRYEGAFDKVAKLELDNPKKKNALSVDLLSQVTSLSHSLILLSKTSISNRT